MIQENIIELKDEERQICEQWTRCMGYYRPVSFYNIGKKQEYKDRKNYVISDHLFLRDLEGA